MSSQNVKIKIRTLSERTDCQSVRLSIDRDLIDAIDNPPNVAIIAETDPETGKSTLKIKPTDDLFF